MDMKFAVAHSGERRNAHRTLVGKLARKRCLEELGVDGGIIMNRC
jgi:hypothetical protein